MPSIGRDIAEIGLFLMSEIKEQSTDIGLTFPSSSCDISQGQVNDSIQTGGFNIQ